MKIRQDKQKIDIVIDKGMLKILTKKSEREQISIGKIINNILKKFFNIGDKNE